MSFCIILQNSCSGPNSKGGLNFREFTVDFFFCSTSYRASVLGAASRCDCQVAISTWSANCLHHRNRRAWTKGIIKVHFILICDLTKFSGCDFPRGPGAYAPRFILQTRGPK